MIPLHSEIQSKEHEYGIIRTYLEKHDFTVGGNWEYDRGFFDMNLDAEQKVWLRLPFEVTNGVIDREADHLHAKIRMGQPFVLKHVYNEGLDTEAKARMLGALFDQFQEPTDKDADVEPHWVDEAKRHLREVERQFPQ